MMPPMAGTPVVRDIYSVPPIVIEGVREVALSWYRSEPTGHVIDAQVCHLCGFARSGTVKMPGELVDKPNELGAVYWMQFPMDCPHCGVFFQNFPQVAQWVFQVLVFHLHVEHASVESHEHTTVPPHEHPEATAS